MADNKLKEIEAAYAELDKAFRNKDLDTVARYTASDWKGTASGKAITREQLTEHVRSQFETLDNISWPRTVSLLADADEKVVIRAAGTYTAVKRENGEPIELELSNDDTWTRGPKGWQITRSVSVE
jgi:ketosteroid isomerase-like protein